MDLFETPDLIPDNVKEILNTWDESINSYTELSRIVDELNKIGYTFDYGLDASPFDLHKIN